MPESSEVFIDANVLVYAMDHRFPDKRDRAAQAIRFVQDRGEECDRVISRNGPGWRSNSRPRRSVSDSAASRPPGIRPRTQATAGDVVRLHAKPPQCHGVTIGPRQTCQCYR